MILLPNISTITLYTAYKRGYRVVEGKVKSPTNRIRRERISLGYKKFNITLSTKIVRSILTHRLLALQKFGLAIFEDGIEVRHLDGNKLNNSWDNIAIGTHYDNMLDMPKDIRLKAATSIRKFTDSEMEHIRQLHREGWTYKQLMEEFNISSKGTMSHIINHKYITKK